MSGFGVNVTKLKDLAGWNHSSSLTVGQSGEEPLGAVWGPFISQNRYKQSGKVGQMDLSLVSHLKFSSK